MQNFERFRTTPDFDRKYLRNGLRYRQAATALSTTIASTFDEEDLVTFGLV